MLKIRVRDRVQASPPPGMRQGWTEYQVVDGRKVVGKFDTREQAKRAFPDATEQEIEPKAQ